MLNYIKRLVIKLQIYMVPRDKLCFFLQLFVGWVSHQTYINSHITQLKRPFA